MAVRWWERRPRGRAAAGGGAAVLVALALTLLPAVGAGAQAPTGPGGQPTTPPSSGAPAGPAGQGGAAQPSGGGNRPTGDEQEARRAALAAASLEAALLYRLGAFATPLPPGAEQVFAAVDVGGVGDQLQALQQADSAGENVHAALGGASLSSEADQALRRLPPSDMERIRAKQPVTLSAEVYLDAIYDLATNGGNRPPTGTRTIDAAELAAIVGRIPSGPILQAGGAGQGSAGQGASGQNQQGPPSTLPPPPATSSGLSPVVIAALIAWAGIVAVAVAWVVLRRRSRRDDRELLRIAARLTRAADLAEAEQIAVAEAAALAGGDAGAVIAVPQEGAPFVSYQSEDLLLVEDRLADGVFGQVIDAGTPVATVSQTEPALARLPASVVAVPLILNGRVRAVLAVVRSSARPFDAATVDTMTRLAPVVAAALDSTGRMTELSTMALVDGLTRVGNRRRFDKDLATLLTRSEASGLPVSLVMIDVDHFKHFNDTNGHLAGDEALKAVAQVVSDGARRADATYRFGGEEFCVILPDADEADALAVAERMRAAVAATDVEGGSRQPLGSLTASLGVASAVGGSADDLTSRADQALYEAKRAGRNRVTAASALDPA